MADLFLADQFTFISLAKASVDFIEQVEAIQGIFNAGVIGLFNRS